MKSNFILVFVALILLLFSDLKVLAAPTVVSSDSIAPYSAGATHSVVLNKPAGLQNGDMLVALILNRRADPDGATVFELPISAPGGWTVLSPWPRWLGPGILGTAYMAYKVISNAGSEASSYSFDISTTPASVIVGDAAIVQIRNGASAIPSEAYDYLSAAGGETNIEAPAVNSQGDSLWIVSGLGQYWSTNLNPSASPAGFTNLEYQSDNTTAYLGFSVDYKTVSNGDTGVATYSRTGSAVPYAASSLVVCEGGAPTDVSYYPSPSQVYIPRISSLVLTLSSTPTKGSGNIYIKKYSDDSTLLTIPVGSSNVVIEGNEVKIRLLTCLAPGEQVYVTIDSGVFLGSCNSSYAGISNKDTWKFNMSQSCNMLYSEF